MKTIEQFIDDFRMREANYGDYEEAEETVRHLFRAGYCYYFAKMLEIAYPGGEVCVCYPYSHMVYHYNGKYYDIEGEYDKDWEDCEYLIPERFLGDTLKDFLHNGSTNGSTKEQLDDVLHRYLTGE